MLLEKYSFGVGDRFGKQGSFQLEAIQEINSLGIPVVPVWNKSYREHTIINTTQKFVAKEASEAVTKCDWKGNYYVDADHIGLSTVDEFIDYSNFFTIDVAHFIGQPAPAEEKNEFIKRNKKYLGGFSIPGIGKNFSITEDYLAALADKYLLAILEVKKIYNYIENKKGHGNFIPEVSMDECELAQTPIELFFILNELKHRNIELQTIAPKFSGLFAKGIDYIGNKEEFTSEFEQDVAVIRYACDVLELPSNLKLSVHSGSDKFSIYPAIKNAIKKYDAGIHVKTAGTTWLEEIIGLAEAGGRGLDIAKKIYSNSLARYDELTKPYATVLNIEKSQLPAISTVNMWTEEDFSQAITHNPDNEKYNSSFRQLIHVGYKIAVELGEVFTEALDEYKEIIGRNVKYNILERHLKKLFLNE